MIVEAPKNNLASFYFPGIHHPAMSMTVGKVGPLRKIVIAARFNISVAVGWPELQIIRTVSDEIPKVAFTTNATEPKPTGYLNLYEYDLVAKNFDIQDGDTVNISWHGNVLWYDQIRFSLAYYHNGTSPAIPMVSIVVGDCESETDLLSLNTLYCEDVTQANTNPISKSDEIIIISGVVAFSLLLLIILLIFLVVFTFVAKRRRKSASVNVTQPQMLHSTLSKYTNKIKNFFYVFSR